MKPDLNLIKDKHESTRAGRHSLANPLRLLLYSHDSWGLGHLRRSLAIANAVIERFDEANVLLVTGSPCATQFDLPSRCDVLKLPAVSKDLNGRYIPRGLSGTISKTIELRRRLIHESYRAFDPHMVIVDHQLTGLHGEALSMLREARNDGKKLIYGMRDVLDEPAVVEESWRSAEHQWALQHAYDKICVYGCAEVFDPRQHYESLKPFSHKIEFTGYITPSPDKHKRQAIPSFRKKVLVTMGGGEDGVKRVRAYLDALQAGLVSWDSHIITGPLMEKSQVRQFKRQIQLAGLTDHVKLTRFHPNILKLLQESDAVVGMAGYNSCAEIMKSGIPAILMPRSHPRKEQLIRAQRMEELDLARCISGDNSQVLFEAIESALNEKDRTEGLPDLNGLESLCNIISGILFTDPETGKAQDDEQIRAVAE